MSSLTECDGTAVLRTECLLGTTDLTFCECQLCQVYTERTSTGESPPLENAVVTTVLRPGVESNHSLCLNHWTFFRIETAAPQHVQEWQDPDVRGERSVINAQLGSLEDNPQQLVLTLDTMYDATYERYTTVDAFLHAGSILMVGRADARPRRAVGRPCVACAGAAALRVARVEALLVGLWSSTSGGKPAAKREREPRPARPSSFNDLPTICHRATYGYLLAHPLSFHHSSAPHMCPHASINQAGPVLRA